MPKTAQLRVLSGTFRSKMDGARMSPIEAEGRSTCRSNPFLFVLILLFFSLSSCCLFFSFSFSFHFFGLCAADTPTGFLVSFPFAPQLNLTLSFPLTFFLLVDHFSSLFIVLPFRALFVRRFSFSGPFRSSFFFFGSCLFIVFPFRVLFVHRFSFSGPLRSSFFLFLPFPFPCPFGLPFRFSLFATARRAPLEKAGEELPTTPAALMPPVTLRERQFRAAQNAVLHASHTQMSALTRTPLAGKASSSAEFWIVWAILGTWTCTRVWPTPDHAARSTLSLLNANHTRGMGQK